MSEDCHDSGAKGVEDGMGEQHEWDRAGERCLKCGDKDWMGGPCRAKLPKPPATPAMKDEVESATTGRVMCAAHEWLDEKPCPFCAATNHEFKNFHRNLCNRFGYPHDEKDWKRDQASLEEHIASLIVPPSPTLKDEVASTEPQRPRLDFWGWWRRDGKFYDPDTDDVPWFDKRQFLAERAFDAGVAQSTNHIANREIYPRQVSFANGRVVSIRWVDGEAFLEVSMNEQIMIEAAALPTLKDEVYAMLAELNVPGQLNNETVRILMPHLEDAVKWRNR